jgi:hypothetical protein
MITPDQPVRCAYLRYLDDLLERGFGVAVSESRQEYVFFYSSLDETQKRAHDEWKTGLHAKIDAVLAAECPGVDPECCDRGAS